MLSIKIQLEDNLVLEINHIVAYMNCQTLLNQDKALARQTAVS